MSTHSTQLLLEQDQYEAVARLARTQQRPVTEILREFVQLGLSQLEQGRQRKLDALRELNELRGELESRFGTYPGDPVRDARVDRERQMEAVLLPAAKA